LNNSVKTSHECLLVNIESYLSQLYSHFSSSSKRVAALKEYFEFVQEDYLVNIPGVPKVLRHSFLCKYLSAEIIHDPNFSARRYRI
jgi:hypothetical protein